MNWHFKLATKRMPKLRKPVLIEGLPGIGNVGKVAVDFMIDSKNAKKLYDVFSYSFPHSVFVNENNLVELPKVEIYYVKGKSRDILLLSGDVQPAEEKSCYQFCETLVETILKKLNCKEVVTLGGIGLQKIPKEPKVFITGTDPDVIDTFAKKHDVKKELYGIVGPIIGVTGVLLGMAGKKGIKSIALLSETFGHPMFLGVNGARVMLKILDKEYKIGVNLKRLDKEIKELETDMVKKANEFSEVSKKSVKEKLSKKIRDDETNYIG